MNDHSRYVLCCFIGCDVLSLADHEKLISAELEQFLEAIAKYCEPYRAMDCAAKHVRHAISLTYPSVMHTPSPDPIGLVPVGVKRKYEHCDSLGAMGPPVRKLAYQSPRPLGTSRWPIRAPRVSSMPMTGFTPGGCAAESSALRVARPYPVSNVGCHVQSI